MASWDPAWSLPLLFKSGGSDQAGFFLNILAHLYSRHHRRVPRGTARHYYTFTSIAHTSATIIPRQDIRPPLIGMEKTWILSFLSKHRSESEIIRWTFLGRADIFLSQESLKKNMSLERVFCFATRLFCSQRRFCFRNDVFLTYKNLVFAPKEGVEFKLGRRRKEVSLTSSVRHV